ncbi:hypothetical protein FOVG_11120 [Fusarium oxysporum f. sp. pisi HDV247]|nr:hypothetical protein FOVG_11120 [Fusarium oxysporum f. sp. pisi HDV247]
MISTLGSRQTATRTLSRNSKVQKRGIVRPWRHRKDPHMRKRGSRDGYGRSQRDLIFWQLLAKLTDHSVGQMSRISSRLGQDKTPRSFAIFSNPGEPMDMVISCTDRESTEKSNWTWNEGLT